MARKKQITESSEIANLALTTLYKAVTSKKLNPIEAEMFGVGWGAVPIEGEPNRFKIKHLVHRYGDIFREPIRQGIYFMYDRQLICLTHQGSKTVLLDEGSYYNDISPSSPNTPHNVEDYNIVIAIHTGWASFGIHYPINLLDTDYSRLMDNIIYTIRTFISVYLATVSYHERSFYLFSFTKMKEALDAKRFTLRAGAPPITHVIAELIKEAPSVYAQYQNHIKLNSDNLECIDASVCLDALETLLFEIPGGHVQDFHALITSPKYRALVPDLELNPIPDVHMTTNDALAAFEQIIQHTQKESPWTSPLVYDDKIDVEDLVTAV